jgi:hypothetical protein
MNNQDAMPVDPIPETPSTAAPSVAEPVTTPAPVAQVSAPSEGFLGLDSTNLRRLIYVALILIIALVAFYMTRPSKKQKFDMLDVTADAGRQRVGKDSQKEIG